MKVLFKHPQRLWNQIPFIKLLREFASTGAINPQCGSLASAKRLADDIQAGVVTTLVLNESLSEGDAQVVVGQLQQLGFVCTLDKEEVPFPGLPPPGAGLPPFDLRMEALEVQVAELKEELNARTVYLEKALDRIARLEETAKILEKLSRLLSEE